MKPDPDLPRWAQAAQALRVLTAFRDHVSPTATVPPSRMVRGWLAEGIEALTWMLRDRCPVCAGEMRSGQVLQSTWVGSADFAGDPHPVTVSPGGPGKMVPCMKCTLCGHSVTA